jgi:hypothetical protein
MNPSASFSYTLSKDSTSSKTKAELMVIDGDFEEDTDSFPFSPRWVRFVLNLSFKIKPPLNL